jgi:hypothetical protein
VENATALPAVGSVISSDSGSWFSQPWSCCVVRIVTMSRQPNPLVQRARDSRFSLQFGRQRSRAADHRR